MSYSKMSTLSQYKVSNLLLITNLEVKMTEFRIRKTFIKNIKPIYFNVNLIALPQIS